MSASQTILVIDDDIKFSLGLAAILRRGGYQVSVVHNGTDGLAAVQNLIPDIILCDIMMPPPNGFQLKKQLEKSPETDRIPFLFLTARTAPVDKTVGLENGADDYITKPFDVNELLARIHSVLRRDEMGRLRGIKESSAAIDQLRSSISTNISHELRTPLTVLISTLDLVVRERFTESNRELFKYVKMASSSAQRIKFLIEDLEMLYDIDQGKLNTLRQPILLRIHVNGAIDQVLKDWENKKVKLHLDIDPRTVIYAPRNGFIHAISHLVQNACKFSPQNGEIIISIRENGLGGCVLEVKDMGPGIPLDLRAKVFERYYQISQGDTRQYDGLGVGLFIVRAFIESLGGDVQVLDSPVGCRVRMVLPPFDLDNIIEGANNDQITSD